MSGAPDDYIWDFEYHEQTREEFQISLDLPDRLPLPSFRNGNGNGDTIHRKKRRRDDADERPLEASLVPTASAPKPGRAGKRARTELPQKLRFLDVPTSKNPIIAQDYEIHLCHWTSTSGTGLFFRKPAPSASSADAADRMPLQRPQNILLGASRVRLAVEKTRSERNRHVSADSHRKLRTRVSVNGAGSKTALKKVGVKRKRSRILRALNNDWSESELAEVSSDAVDGGSGGREHHPINGAISNGEGKRLEQDDESPVIGYEDESSKEDDEDDEDDNDNADGEDEYQSESEDDNDGEA